MDALFLSVDDAAKALAIGRSKAYELIAAGELPVVRLGRRTLVPARALAEWVDRIALASQMATPGLDSTESGAKAVLTNESGNPFDPFTARRGAPRDRRGTTKAPLAEVV